jgi:type VI protein secretion system component VasF
MRTQAIMAMPIFYLDETKGLAISSSWWIYVLLALLVTAVTVTFWRWSLSRKRKARHARLGQEKRKDGDV